MEQDGRPIEKEKVRVNRRVHALIIAMVYNGTTMKLLIFTPHYYPENVSIHGLTEALVRLGHTIQVITFQPYLGFGEVPHDYEKITDEIINGVNVHRFPIKYAQTNKGWQFFRRWRLQRTLQHYLESISMRIDGILVFTFGDHGVMYPMIHFAKKQNKRIGWYMVYPRRDWVQPQVLFGRVDQLFLATEAHRLWLPKQYRKTKTSMIPLPAMMESLGKDRLDFGPGFHVLTMVEGQPLSSLHTLFKRWATLPKTFHLHCVELGTNMASITALVATLHLERNVHVYAHQTTDHLHKFFAGADAFFISQPKHDKHALEVMNRYRHYLPFGQPIIDHGNGETSMILSTFPFSWSLTMNMDNLASCLRRIKAIKANDLLEIQQAYRAYYQTHFQAMVGAKAIELYFRSTNHVSKD